MIKFWMTWTFGHVVKSIVLHCQAATIDTMKPNQPTGQTPLIKHY